MKGKLKEWDVELDHPHQAEDPTEWEDLETSGGEPGMGDFADYHPDLDSDLDLEDLDFGPKDYEFIPQDQISECDAAESEEEIVMEGIEYSEAGPGPQTAANRLRAYAAAHAAYRVLDDDDDERIVVVEKDAGHVCRKEKPPNSKIYDKEGDVDMTENPFHPFNSELDWRIAQWAIKEDPGHKAFDRLLSIPGVSHTFCKPATGILKLCFQVVENLGLSYHNTRSLHQKVDGIPERAGDWQTRTLSFKDRPNDAFTVRFRD